MGRSCHDGRGQRRDERFRSREFRMVSRPLVVPFNCRKCRDEQLSSGNRFRHAEVDQHLAGRHRLFRDLSVVRDMADVRFDEAGFTPSAHRPSHASPCRKSEGKKLSDGTRRALGWLAHAVGLGWWFGYRPTGTAIQVVGRPCGRNVVVA